MFVVEIQRPIAYVNNAHRSTVLAARLLYNLLFDKARPREQMHPHHRAI
jgi:hypothetical protein